MNPVGSAGLDSGRGRVCCDSGLDLGGAFFRPLIEIHSDRTLADWTCLLPCTKVRWGMNQRRREEAAVGTQREREPATGDL
jgi:hypothetical protein